VHHTPCACLGCVCGVRVLVVCLRFVLSVGFLSVFRAYEFPSRIG